jgi:hypothetical protein
MNARARDQRTRLTRRRLLGGMSALGVALTSPVWRSASVFGADANQKPLRRFIGVFSANGTIASEFFPESSGDAPLSADKLGRILKPMAAHVDQLLVLKGVDMVSTVTDELGKTVGSRPGGPHMKGPGAMLTGGALGAGSFEGAGGPAGYADRISVDQYIAGELGKGSTFPSLELGVRVGGGHPLDTISYRGANQPNPPVNDPVQVYKRLFANNDLSSSELARLVADRKTVLDFVQSDIQSLQKKLSSTDKARLDAHLTGIRALEQQLSNAASSCSAPTKPSTFDGNDQASFEPISKLQMDLMLLAHVCGLTNVSTLMFANADSWQYFPFAGVNEEHHELSHAGDDDDASREKLIKINTWHGQQINYLLDKLSATEEADGSSMLDNTLLLWGNELGAGNTHDYQNIPWLLAGGSSYFKMGRSLKYDHKPHNDLLVSVCHAMGLADVTTFGIPGCCTGALPGLTG